MGGTGFMDHKVLKEVKSPTRRRQTAKRAPSRSPQYSLFAALPAAPSGDARHFRRQAQLCRRLSRALHQADLVALLDRLEDEFETAADRIETTAHSHPPAL
jgi:hypothetical protein